MYQIYSFDCLWNSHTPYTPTQLAETIEVNMPTINRWEVLENVPPSYLSDTIRQDFFL